MKYMVFETLEDLCEATSICIDISMYLPSKPGRRRRVPIELHPSHPPFFFNGFRYLSFPFPFEISENRPIRNANFRFPSINSQPSKRSRENP